MARLGVKVKMSGPNHFIDSLPTATLERLRPSLETVELSRDQLLTETGQPVVYAYLPTSCIVSVVAVMHDGRSVESRTIGREGGFGLLHALGSRISQERVTCQVAGEALRLPADALDQAARNDPMLVKLIVQHAQATIVQATQNTACNSLHGAEQRLARWLLLTEDRLESEVLPLTQEHLAIMLGVQRTTVTAIASELQDRGLIRYSRGKITVLNREGLIRSACECYGAIGRFSEAMHAD
jgi:CRP-like cAMP-binding protein